MLRPSPNHGTQRLPNDDEYLKHTSRSFTRGRESNYRVINGMNNIKPNWRDISHSNLARWPARFTQTKRNSLQI